MGVVGATTLLSVTARHADTPIRPSGTFPREAGEGSGDYNSTTRLVTGTVLPPHSGR